MNLLKYRKIFILLGILSNCIIFNKIYAETNNSNLIKNINDTKLDTQYLLPKNELEDYIIDTGDKLFIEFENRPRGLGEINDKSLSTKDVSYLNPRNDLKNYLLDKGDIISINFFIDEVPDYREKKYTIDQEGLIVLPDVGEVYVRGLNIDELTILLKKRYEDYLLNPKIEINIFSFRFIDSGIYEVNAEGEMILPLIEETYVRGLTKGELSKLLSKKYQDSEIIFPKVKIRIVDFKPQRVLVYGEVRKPGILYLPGYSASGIKNFKSLKENPYSLDKNEELAEKLTTSELDKKFAVKRSNDFIPTISDAIRSAGGITAFTDLSRIEITRDIPLGKGGGKKRALINLNSFLINSDPTNDIRLFDGDRLYFPKLDKKLKDQIPKSILKGLTPQFIEVNISGAVRSPGKITLPLEASLSDLIELSGGKKPFAGKVILIRYEKDGSLTKNYISYSPRANPGSKRNPYLTGGELITVKEGVIRQTTELITEATDPFIGIYATKEIIESFD